MRIFTRGTLIDFWKKHPDAELPLRTWFAIVDKAAWKGPADVKVMFGAADFLADNRVIFDIKGNKYRIVAHVRYDKCMLFIRFVGTHAEYSKIDATTI